MFIKSKLKTSSLKTFLFLVPLVMYGQHYARFTPAGRFVSGGSSALWDPWPLWPSQTFVNGIGVAPRQVTGTGIQVTQDDRTMDSLNDELSRMLDSFPDGRVDDDYVDEAEVRPQGEAERGDLPAASRAALDAARHLELVESHIIAFKKSMERLDSTLCDLPDKYPQVDTLRSFGEYGNKFAQIFCDVFRKPRCTITQIGATLIELGKLDPLARNEWISLWLEQKGIVDKQARPGDEECSLCLDRSLSAILPCGHTFCGTCILTAYYTKSEQTSVPCAACPHCRATYVTKDISRMEPQKRDE
jgi:hypothetical protein